VHAIQACTEKFFLVTKPHFNSCKKLIGFNIKNLKLYIDQDSFNKLKGEIYGMGSTCRSSVVHVVSTVIKRSPK